MHILVTRQPLLQNLTHLENFQENKIFDVSFR